MPPRKLIPDAIVTAAVSLADADGSDALTMRGLARHLGVEAMSLYHHFASKDALLDAMVDRVYGEIALPNADSDWRTEVHRRSESVRAVLHRHPWALPLMESRRTPGPANLAYHDANIACLRAVGFTPAQVAHAYAVVDAFVYGFVLQEATLPFDSGAEAATMIHEGGFGDVLTSHPNMAWFAQEVILAPDYSFAREFGPGLDLVLDGLAAQRDTPSSGARRARRGSPG